MDWIKQGEGFRLLKEAMPAEMKYPRKFDILIVDGRDLDELRNAILGKPIKGTFVDSHREGPGPRTAPAPIRRRL